MKFIVIATFLFGVFTGVWMTGNEMTVSTIVSQNCLPNNKAQIVLFNNIKVSSPLGHLTCEHKDTINKGLSAVDTSIDKIDKGLDEINKHPVANESDLDSIGYGFNS